MGGLGNQLFQISASISLAIDNNDEFGFDFDSCQTNNQGYSANKYKNNLFKNILDLKNFKFDNWYEELNFSYNEIPYKKNMLLSGYFQSEKYFKKNFHKIKNILNFDELILDNIKKKYNPFKTQKKITTVHVRRGDYVGLEDFHGLCNVNYFNKAMSLIGDSFFIFISDDLDWVKKKFKGDNILYSDYNDEIYDLLLMTISDNNIISNSTFSWWGAYLNPNESKKIISPQKWFGVNGIKNYQDVVPPEWIKI